MKKVLIIVAIFFSFTALTAFPPAGKPYVQNVFIDSDFCDGWEDGYCEGWKDVKGQLSLCPLTPLCPLPEIEQDTYKGGYNKGFKAGMRAAKK